jgi:hypothetical protein
VTGLLLPPGVAGAQIGDPYTISFATAWTHIDTSLGRRMCAVIDNPPLAQMILGGIADVRDCSVAETSANTEIQMLLPALWMLFDGHQLYVPIERGPVGCPFNLETELPRGFAIAVAHPDPSESRLLYVASRRLARRNRTHRRVGRNEPCPCGSGVKFKRCHGA